MLDERMALVGAHRQFECLAPGAPGGEGVPGHLEQVPTSDVIAVMSSQGRA